MGDQTNTESSDRGGQESGWKDVGDQFEALGESLANAFRTAWNDEENRRQVKELQNGLEKMVNQVSRAIQDAAESPEGQKVRTEAERAVDNLRSASEQTAQEVRPRLVNALKQVNEEIQKIVDRMEKK